MKKRSLFVVPVMALSLMISTSEEVNSFLGFNSVYVTYKSITYKNEDEGFFGTKTAQEKVKTFRVRRGVSWNRRNNREKPSNPNALDLDLEFKNFTDSQGNDISDDKKIDEDMVVYSKYALKELSHNWDDTTPLQLAKIIEQAKTSEPEKTMLEKIKKWFNLGESDTFIGKPKTFEYGGLEYKTKVIGIEKDTISDSNEKAFFTFEFEECIPAIPFDISSRNKNNYEGSYLRYYLNNICINNFSKSFRKAVKSVKKRTNVGEGTSTSPSFGQTKVVDDKIFILSLSEMNASEYNILRKTEKPSYKYPEAIDAEGTLYDYYKKNEEGHLPSLFKKVKGETNNTRYWVRSPELEAYSFSWFVNPTNDNSYEIGVENVDYMEQAPEPVTNSMPVAPCFCI